MLVLIVAVSFGSLGCSSDSTNEPADAGGDVVEVDMADPVICEPEEIRCLEENSPGIERCNAEGTEFVEAACSSTPLQVCREDACVEVSCIPGNRRCASPEQPEVCDDQGDGFVEVNACTSGARCEAGNCLNRCQVAEATNSYIGCEYWAVELENHLLNDNEDRPLSPDERPPFAIVLSNPSPDFDARISVYADEGVFAEAVASREVGADIQLPGNDLVTVESEVLGPNGQQLFTIDGPIDNIVLPRGSTMTLIMPFREIPFGASSVTKTSYRVVSNEPVVAYQFNPLCCNYTFTNDASLLLPTSALTGNYMFMSYAVFAGTPSSRLADPYSPTMTVLATEPDTQVNVRLTPSAGANSFSDIIYPTSGAITGPDASGNVQVTLQPHEVLNVAARGVSPVEDMTGSLITADKPVSVFGGHTCAFVPFSSPACDHLESQLFPIETWGQRFIASPLKLRRTEDDPPVRTREGTYWKFVAYQNDTRIETGIDISLATVLAPADEGVRPCAEFSDQPESGTFTLNAGQTCEFGTTELFVVDSGRPIMLGAFLSGQNSVREDAEFGDRAGDPAFFLVPPEEQYRTRYSFLTPGTYFQSFVTVLVPPGIDVILDGEAIDITQHDYVIDEDANIARAHIEVDEGPHTIEASLPFGIIVYGYDDFVSYAYTGGLDLTKLNIID